MPPPEFTTARFINRLRVLSNKNDPGSPLNPPYQVDYHILKKKALFRYSHIGIYEIDSKI